MKKALVVLFIMSSIWILSGCNQLLKLAGSMGVQKPVAKVLDARLEGLSFTRADMTFDIRIVNPNPVSLKLAGLDYALEIAGDSLFNGVQNKQLTLSANDSSVLSIPVSITYADMFRAVKTLLKNETTAYTFKAGLLFDVPVLGNVRVPVQYSGTLPVLSLPKVSLKALQLNRLSWSGADLAATVSLQSTGGYPVQVGQMGYTLEIAGKALASGRVERPQQLAGDADRKVVIPLKLDFLQMGRALYDMIMGDEPVAYRIRGAFEVKANWPGLKPGKVRFDQSDTISLLK
ncbi:MAG: hypothetical protein D6677_13945 [Calditrichaeota bacterium]|nr:MAG: hypothetical protein D6677_13945 [Calditrichota bacterium]